MIVTTFQAVSGAGVQGIEDLKNQIEDENVPFFHIKSDSHQRTSVARGTTFVYTITVYTSNLLTQELRHTFSRAIQRE